MRRNERAVPKTQQRAAEPNEIRPKFRFLLSEEARAEGKQMVRNFRGYTLSRSPDETRSQFSSIARGILERRYPNIATADEIMGGKLVASVQKIAAGFRQPEWMLWRSSWANALADGWPNRMEGAAMTMLERDERFSISQIDDETAMLPTTTVDAVYAGGSYEFRNRLVYTPASDKRPTIDPIEPARLEQARTWYRDVFEKQVFANKADRVAAIRAFTDEQREAHHERIREDDEIARYAQMMISEIERVTREKFALAWKTKDDLHAALRAHFKACGYDEELNLRWLRLGEYL